MKFSGIRGKKYHPFNQINLYQAKKNSCYSVVISLSYLVYKLKINVNFKFNDANIQLF